MKSQKWFFFIVSALVGSCVTWQLESAVNRLVSDKEMRELLLKALRVLTVMAISLSSFAYAFKDSMILVPTAVIFLMITAVLVLAYIISISVRNNEYKQDIDMMDAPNFTVTRKRDRHMKKYWSFEDDQKKEIGRIYLQHEPHSWAIDEYSILCGIDETEKRIGSLTLRADWGESDQYELKVSEEGYEMSAKVYCSDSYRMIEVFVGSQRMFELFAKNGRRRVYYGYRIQRG